MIRILPESCPPAWPSSGPPSSGLALLRTIRARVPADCPWVFPGDAEGKPVQEIKRSNPASDPLPSWRRCR
jgi:hypothetical protein